MLTLKVSSAVSVSSDTCYISTMHSSQPTLALLCLVILASHVLHAEAKLPTPPYTK